MATKPNLKLLIFGIDGGDPRIIKFGIDQGIFPNMASIAKDGFCNTLRCTWPPHTSTGWPSLFSGKLPGEHGIFQFWDCQDVNYSLKATLSTDIQVPMIWDRFQQSGWKMGLVNIPMSYPPNEWSGFQFTWPLVKTLRYCRPPQLIRQLQKAGGLHLPDIAYMYNGEEDYPRKALGLIQKRTKGIQMLLEKYPVDVLAVVYPETDRISHHYWHGLDPSHSKHSLSSAFERKSIIQVYKEMDNALGILLKNVSDNAVVMVVSDHGFGPGENGFRLHQELRRAGFCDFECDNPVGQNSDHLEELSGKINVLERFNWDKTKAYIPTPGSFGVNLNMKGRQAAGIIDPSDAPQVEKELIHFLQGLRNPVNGSKVFRRVLPSRSFSAPRFANKAPDLLLVPEDPSLMILSGIDGATWVDSPQVGLHRMEGFCMMKGPNISAIESPTVMAIEDVAGQLLKGLDLPAHGFADERGVVEELSMLEECWSSSNDPLLELQDDQLIKGDDIIHTADEMDFIMPESDHLVLERLKGLGYID